MSSRPSRLRIVGHAALLLGFGAFGVFYLMIAAGGASFVHECSNVICAQLHQAMFAAIAGAALFIAAYHLWVGKWSAWRIAFVGTLPILVVHVILVMEDPNESMFFPLSSLPVPVLAGSVLLVHRARRRI